MTTSNGDRPLPGGTVTFLFTDIEGSTRLLQRLGSRYDRLLEEHRRLIRTAVEAEGGHEVSTEGDAFFVVFASAARAVAAAVAAQRALTDFAWPEDAIVRVRMGVHTGEGTPAAGDYVGLDVHRAARICAAAHGGQILVSHATRALVEANLPTGIILRSMGEHRLKDLLRPEHLFQVVAPGLPEEFPPLRTLDRAPNNLPTQLTSFVGRERELAEARRLLDRTRLLTLTGPGGTGKTRLALHLGVDVIDQFPDGVYFVPLAPVVDPSFVPSTVGRALGIQESGGESLFTRLVEFLSEKQLLLILDNFEQILDAAPFVSDLLKATSKVKVAVTSRAALRVYGEQEFPVPPLGLPDLKHLPSLDALSQYEAVALFIQRAVAAKPDFTVTNANAPAIAEITSRLDGLPLAIELAAARIKLLPPQAMLARLQHRLNLLSGGARDLPARQQTLRDAIAWSYDLLDEPGRRLMARVSVFVGGCTLEAAEAVCGPASELGRDVLEGLAALADHSLLRHQEVDGEPRFSMLETIREFAVERLEAGGEAPAIRRRHAATFLSLAEQGARRVFGEGANTWLDRLEREHDNLRAAITWAIEHGEAETALRFGAALWRFWQMRGHVQEGRERLNAILAMPGAQGLPAYAAAVEAAGGIAYWQGDFDGARSHYEQQLTLARARGDALGTAEALYNLSFPYVVPKSDLERGRALLHEALTIYEQAQHKPGIAKTHWGLASVEFALRHGEAALHHVNVCLPLFRELNDRFSLGWALHSAGLAHMQLNDLRAARTALIDGLRLFAEARDVSGIAGSLQDLANLALLERDVRRAARLIGGAAGLVHTGGADLWKFFEAMAEGWRVGDVRLDKEALASDVEAGRAMSLDDLIAYALEPSAAAPAEVPR
ncbi:MAG: adenylate/guanylate cyclase domain-containing protein [Armatimonadota bacterium]|nr:adenylate/guanylate cyclase domain-containing protein [Armatimonadota bacterium]